MSVGSLRFALWALAIGLLGATALEAQQPGGRGRGFGGGFGFQSSPIQDKLRYLANEAVQKDLELADDQKADLTKISEEARTKMQGAFNFQGFRELSEAEREKRMTEVRTKAEALGKEQLKKVEAVLLPHQLDRLQEIWVQVQGTNALSNDEVAKKLGISEDQKKKIDEIRDQSRQQFGQRPGQGQGQGGQDFAARMATIRKERDEKVTGVLTAEQKDQFAKMKGEPFDVDAANLRFGGFGGRGGRPGQGARPGQGGRGGQPRTRPGGNNNNN